MSARPTPSHTAWPNAALRRGVAIILLMAGLILGGICLHTAARNAVLRDATSSLTKAAADSAILIAARLQHYETLQTLAGPLLGLPQPPDPSLPAARDFLRAAAVDQSMLMRITLFGPSGQALGSPFGLNPDHNIIGRDYFDAIRTGQAATAIGSEMLGRARLPAVHFATALRALNGSLLGVTVIAVTPAQLLGNLPASLASSPLGRALLRADGTAIASQGAAFSIPAPLLAAALQSGAAFGHPSSPNQPSTLIVLHRIGPFPLLLALSVDQASILAASAQTLWYQDVMAAALLAALCAIGTAIALWCAARRRARDRDREVRATARDATAMQLVTDNIGAIVSLWQCGPDGTAICQFVSPSLHSMLGLSSLTTSPDQSLPEIHPDDHAMYRLRLADMLAGIPSPDQDLRAVSGNGTPFWFHVSTRPIRNATANTPRRYIVVWHDITARKHAESIAETLRLRVDSLADNAPGCLYDAEITLAAPHQRASTALHYISPGFANLTGYAPGQFDLPSTFACIATDWPDGNRQAVLQAVLTEGETGLEYDLVCADGHQVHVRDHIKIVGRTATTARLIGYMVDITDEVVLRDRLVEIGRLALLGELAASVAHEINQPLSVIMMRAERLRASKTPLSPADIAQAGDVIVAMSERAAKVVRSIRNFARQGDDALAPFDTAEAYGIAITIVEPHLKARPTRITTNFANPHPLAFGNVGHYEQVLVNLIVNAFDAYDVSHPGAVGVVDIAVTTSGTTTITTVTDHAGGIPADVLPRLFEAFYTTKGVGVGTGLGLTICQRLLTDMGGTLSVHNTADGACFTITLPHPIEDASLPLPVPPQ